jgi:hypothetical protein
MPPETRKNTTCRKPGDAMTAEELAYFTDVLKRLDALHERLKDNEYLRNEVVDASAAIGILVGYFINDAKQRARKVSQ